MRASHSASSAPDIPSIPFPDEVAHFQQIKEKLLSALREAERSVDRLDKGYQDAKRYMVQNRGDIDPHEMFQNELSLRQLDRSGAFAVEVRDKIAKQSQSPYFARIDFLPEKESAATYYIGQHAFTDGGKLLIIDWRAPIAGIFYAFEVGPAHYSAPQGQIHGRLLRKRQFKIKDGQMEYALESTDNVGDDVLQRELSQTSDERMKSIIATIQKEQNAIIRNELADTLIIQGVAGSGKTSIALHRIAYLLYRFRQSLSAQNVAIISPNRVFGDFISNVLPELGEEPIFGVSLHDIASVQLEGVIDFEPERNPLEMDDPAWAARVAYKSSPAFVREMDAFIADLPSLVFVPQTYRFEAFEATPQWIQSRMEAYARHPILRRLAMIAEDILDRFETQNIRGEALPKPSAILKSLRAMLAVKSTLAVYRAFYRRLGMANMLVMPGKRRLEWSDVFPFLYLHAALYGLQESRVIRHLVIDEMQDYTPIQYAVINRLFPCPKTILGDFGQAINPNTRCTLGDLRSCYPAAENVELTRSYRSTREIIDLAKRIHPDAEIEAIERHGPAPSLIACPSKDAQTQTVRRMIRAFQASGLATLGIIVKTQGEAQALLEALDKQAGVALISPESEHFSDGVSIASIQMAKGLEFDEVIIPDADDAAYDADHGRNLLYVACTRALHRLTLLHTGKPSQVLRGAL